MYIYIYICVCVCVCVCVCEHKSNTANKRINIDLKAEKDLLIDLCIIILHISVKKILEIKGLALKRHNHLNNIFHWILHSN